MLRRAGWICLLLPSLLGMRDPFRPVADPCLFAQLTLWRYQGFVIVSGRSTALMRGPSGQWLRLQEGATLAGGWKIVRLNKEAVSAESRDRCSPAHWRWTREGDRND